MDLNKLDLTFLIDRAKAIQIRNEVIDEYFSWGNLLSPEEEKKYLIMIWNLKSYIIKHKRLNKQNIWICMMPYII